MKIAQAYDRFLNNRAVYCSKQTIRTYKSHLLNFWKYLESEFQLTVSELDFDDIPADKNIYSGFILHLRENGVRAVTVRSYCRAVKAFLRYCYEHDICEDYMKGVKLPSDDSELKIPLYVDEVERLDKCFDESIKGRRNYAIIHLMLDCGLRSQEVRHLKFRDLDRQHNLLHIRDSKGNKSRIVLCPVFVFDAVQDYVSLNRHTTGHVFRSLKDDSPITEDVIKKLFYTLKKKSGIERIHAHLLRHTFATSYLVGGGNLEFLRVYMGHYDYTVTKGYSSLAAQVKMLGQDIYKLDSIFFERGY